MEKEIRVIKNNGYSDKLYLSFCSICGNERGYKRKNRINGRCKSCSSKRDKTEEERLKISEGVKKFYSDNIKVIKLENLSKNNRKYNKINYPNWKRVRKELKYMDKRFIQEERFNYSDILLENTLNKPCFYCNDKSSGLDRIDNNKGHTVENTVPCCSLCNMTRGNRFSSDEFIEIGRVIKNIKEKRNTKNEFSSNRI